MMELIIAIVKPENTVDDYRFKFIFIFYESDYYCDVVPKPTAFQYVYSTAC
jgi:hypothetical protein